MGFCILFFSANNFLVESFAILPFDALEIFYFVSSLTFLPFIAINPVCLFVLDTILPSFASLIFLASIVCFHPFFHPPFSILVLVFQLVQWATFFLN